MPRRPDTAEDVRRKIAQQIEVIQKAFGSLQACQDLFNTTRSKTRIDDEARAQAASKQWKKYLNLKSKLAKLEDAEANNAANAETNGDIEMIELSSRRLNSSSSNDEKATADIPSALGSPIRTQRENEGSEETTTHYCLYCFTKHASVEVDARFPFLNNHPMNPLLMMKGDDDYSTAAKYCFKSEEELCQHIECCHPVPEDYGGSKEDEEDACIAITAYAPVCSLCKMYTVYNRIDHDLFEKELSTDLQLLRQKIEIEGRTSDSQCFESDLQHDSFIFNAISRIINKPGANWKDIVKVSVSSQTDTQDTGQTDQFGFFSDHQDQDTMLRIQQGMEVLNVCAHNISNRSSRNRIYSHKRRVVSIQTHSDGVVDLYDCNFQSLLGNEWIADEVINPIFERVFAQLFDDCIFLRTDFDSMVFYSEAEDTAPELDNDVLRGKDSVFHAEKLFVPINQGGSHWLLLFVNMSNRTVEVVDSRGVKDIDSKGVKDIRTMVARLLSFLFLHHIEVGGCPITVKDFVAMWRCRNISEIVPRQSNGYDCGVFTIVNCALLAQGIMPTESVYTESDLYSHNIRQKIASIIVDSGTKHSEFEQDLESYQNQNRAQNNNEEKKRKRVELREKRLREEKAQERQSIIDDIEKRNNLRLQQGKRLRQEMRLLGKRCREELPQQSFLSIEIESDDEEIEQGSREDEHSVEDADSGADNAERELSHVDICSNCRRKQFDLSGGPYTITFYSIQSDKIKRKANFKFITKSEKNPVPYTLCTQCYDHLVDGKQDYHSEIYGCIWRLLSKRHEGCFSSYYSHERVPAQTLWRILPNAMRRWWVDSIRLLRAEPYAGCRLEDPCIFADPTIEFEEFLSKLSGVDVNMASLRDALDTPSMMNRQVLCPWGCSSNVRSSGKIGFDLILQRILQSIIVKPTTPNKDKYEMAVKTCWEQYVRNHPDKYDSVMYNKHHWQVKPTILFHSDGPFVLTCPHHDGGTQYEYLYPPRSPHLFNAKTTDQISPIVVKPRITRPLKVNKHATTFAMHKMHTSFAGADTMDITQFNDFSSRTKSGLLADHYALIVAGRSDLLIHVENLERKNITVPGCTETFKAEANKRYPLERIRELSHGATYTNFHDSMTLHLNADDEISAIGLRRRRNDECEDGEGDLFPFNISCRPSWSPMIMLVQMEDIHQYGIQPHAIPPFKTENTATLSTWILAALLAGSKELWGIVHNKPRPFHVSSWEGWLLTYLDTHFPHTSRRADPRSPFKKVQINGVKDIVGKVEDFERNNSFRSLNTPKRRFQAFFPSNDYANISFFDDFYAVYGNSMSQKKAFIYIGSEKPEFDKVEKEHGMFELRVVLRVKHCIEASHKFDAVRYLRHGGHFQNWYRQERDDKIVTRVTDTSFFSSIDTSPADEEAPEDLWVWLYVLNKDPEKEEYRLRFHKSLGGQIRVRCSCNGRPLIPSGLSREKKKERKAQCNCPHNSNQCKRFESFVCSDDQCPLRVCKTCFDKYAGGEMNEDGFVSLSHNVTHHSLAVDEDHFDEDDYSDDSSYNSQDISANSNSEDGCDCLSYDDNSESRLSDSSSRSDDEDDVFNLDDINHHNILAQHENGEGALHEIQEHDLENFLTGAPDTLDYHGLRGVSISEVADIGDFATTNAGELPLRVLPADNMTAVNGHVILNQVASCTRRGQHVIRGTQKQRHFVQKYTHTIAGESYPLLFPEASQFPRHFFSTATDDNDAILGARALPFISANRDFGIASVLDHTRARITCPSSTTSTDCNYHFLLFDTLANFSLGSNHSRDVTNRGFTVDPKSPIGMSVRGKGESSLSGDIDSSKMVKNLAASQKHVEWGIFLTLTLNQSGHPGVKHLHEWKESKSWLSDFMRKSHQFDEPIATEEEFVEAFEAIYAPHCFSNWMETRLLLLTFIKENLTHLGATANLFSRDEHQDDIGNPPHIHLILQVILDHLGIREKEKVQEYLSSLVATSAIEFITNEDILAFREEGLLSEIDQDSEVQRIIDSASKFLPHICRERCLMRVDSTGDESKDFRCRKLHAVKDHPDPHRNAVKQISYPFSQATLDILEECGKYDPSIICQDTTHSCHSCTNCKFLHSYFKSQRHMVKCNTNATDNMSPVDKRLFTVCNSMQNIQLLIHTAGLCKYLVKYLVKRDKVNRAMAFADVHTGNVQVGKERIHNSKIVTSNYNEERAFQKSRNKDHDTGRDISHMEILQMLLGVPEIITNCVWVDVSTQSFDLRPKNRLKRSKEGVVVGADGMPRHPDKHSVGIPMRNLRERMGFASCRKMTTTQKLTFRDHNGKSTCYDEISLFGLRPNELLYVVENPLDYYRLFSVENEETSIDTVEKGMSMQIESCHWYDYLQRRVRIRYLAKIELKALVEANLEYYKSMSQRNTDDEKTEKIAFAISTNTFVLSLVEKDSNPEEFIAFDRNEMLPIPVTSNASPMNSHNFFIHILLSLGKFITEKDVLLHRTSRECFRAARLIGDSDDEDSLKEDALNLMIRYIDEQLVFHPNSYRLTELYLQASRQFFDDAIVHNEFPIHELPPYMMTDVEEAFNEKLQQFWPSKISSQVDSCLSTLSCVDGVPNKEDLIAATRATPLSWNPIDTFSEATDLQSQESYEEQSLAIKEATARIDRYILQGKGVGRAALRYIKNFVIHGAPGTGKSFVTQVAVLYAISKGLRVMSTALMSVRAIVVGGIHLHKLLCLRKGNNQTSPFRVAEEALQRIHRDPTSLYGIQTVDILFVDEIGQVSSEFLSVIDIIFRHVRNSRTPFGGCLILASMDHRQIPPINQLPFLISSLILTSFQMVELRHSVRAHSDPKFQRFQQILRMSVPELIDETTGLPKPEIKQEFDDLIDDPDFIRFVDQWNDPSITPNMTRIYSRKSPAKTAISDMLVSMQSHLDANNISYSVSKAKDLQRRAHSNGEWSAATELVLRGLNSKLREPDMLILTKYCMYEFTVNSPSDGADQYSQSQTCLLIDVPDQSSIDAFKPFKVLTIPPGLTIQFDFNDVENRPTKEDLINIYGWKEVTVRCASESLVRCGSFHGKRQQYFLKHKGAYTINKSQGETLPGGVAVEITPRYSPWQKGQAVVVFSRPEDSDHMIVVGDRKFAKKKLWELITQRTQWCQLMDSILHLVTINNGGNETPSLDYTAHFPFTVANIPIPTQDSGYVYILVSLKDTDQVYIGATTNLAERFRSHNHGSGSTSTDDATLRPWALAGYITGLPQTQIFRSEHLYKAYIDVMKRQGIHDVYQWVQKGGEVAAEYNQNRNSSDAAVFVITIERGSLRVSE